MTLGRSIWTILLTLALLAAAACGDHEAEETGTDAGKTDVPAAADPGTVSDPGSGPGKDEGPTTEKDTALPEDFAPAPFPGVQVDRLSHIEGLDGPVHIVRDDTGIPHIVATTLKDAILAEGYVHAADRLPQMELARRLANGQVAELMAGMSPSTVLGDITNRVYGFARVGEQIGEELEEGDPAKMALDAYAAGVNAYLAELRAGTVKLASPFDLFLPTETFADWEPKDSGAIGRLQAHRLSFDGYRELGLTQDAEAIAKAFPKDHHVTGIALRAGILGDVFIHKPVDTTPIYDTYTPPAPSGVLPLDVGAAARARRAAFAHIQRPTVPEALLERAQRFFNAAEPFASGPRERGMSNSWAVGPEMTATGNAMFCNDPHLDLANPPLFHLVHITLTEGSPDGEMEVWGANIPGVPGILIGHTKHVSWGLTTSNADRSDVFREDFTQGSDGKPPTVKRNGVDVPVTVIKETVILGSLGEKTGEIEIEILVTEDGRVMVPDVTMEGTKKLLTGPQLSFAWTGFETSFEITALAKMLQAKDADDALTHFALFHVPNQNLAGADSSGNIYSFSPAHLPLREPGAMTWDPDTNPGGTAPWWVLPGDSGAAWSGIFRAEDGPKVKNPAKGFVVTANNDHVGQIADGNALNESFYIGYDHALGFRAGRITSLLDGSADDSPAKGGAKLGFDEMVRIQKDTRSSMGSRLRDPLVAVLKAALEEYDMGPGQHLELLDLVAANADKKDKVQQAHDLLRDWDLSTPPAIHLDGSDAGPEELEASSATTIFNIWLVRVVDLTFGDEMEHMGEGLIDKMLARALIHLVEAAPEDMLTLDPATVDNDLGLPAESILWDRMDTADHRELRNEIMLRAMYEAFDEVEPLFGEDRALNKLAWGKLHTKVFGSILPVPGAAYDIPKKDSPFHGIGFPRPGDNYVVNASHPGISDMSFEYHNGSIIRYCVDMAPDGPVAYNMLPGGEVFDVNSPHYDDWMEKWLEHEPTTLLRTIDEVKEKAAERWMLQPKEQ